MRMMKIHSNFEPNLHLSKYFVYQFHIVFSQLSYMTKHLLLIASLFTSVLLNAQSLCTGTRYIDPIFPQVARTNDVVFGNADPYGILTSQDLKMDIYEPIGDTLSKRPVIIFAFGGAFLIGTRTQPPIPDYCEYYAHRGYVVVAIDYRINFNTTDGGSAERAVYRAVQDERAAQRFLAQNRYTYRLDITKFIATGTSAGCVTALHNAYFTEAERPQSSYGNGILEPSDLGCLDCSGNNYYNNQNVPLCGIVNHWGAIGNLTWMQANENVPVCSIHGTNDAIVPYNTGQPFSLPIWPQLSGSGDIAPHLTQLGIYNELHPLWGAGHEPELTNGAYLDSMYLYATPFMYRLLKPATPIITGPPEINGFATFSVPYHVGSHYCWQLDNGGIILADNGNSIDTEWLNMTNADVSVSVTEENYLQAISDTQTLLTPLIPPHGVGTVSNDNAFTLSPNPTSDELNLSLNTAYNKVAVQLYDIDGRVLATHMAYNSSNMKIALSDLVPGIYMLRINADDNVTRLMRFVKQ